MVVKVISVSAEITIIFSDGRTYTVPISDGNTSLSNYCSSIDTDEQLYNSNGKNIVGNISGNSYTFNLISKDRLLIPNNESSTYHGFMNNTAKIELYYTVHYDNSSERVFMGRVYVDTWESGTSSARANEVSILAVDLLSRVKNIPLNKMKLHRYIDVSDFLKDIIDNINNSNLQIGDRINYTNDSIDLFKNSSYDWQLIYNNVERDTFEILLNDIAQNTVSYLWIDRENTFQTDHLLDDSEAESVGVLSGSTNLLEYDLQTGDIDQYGGVRVKFINNITLAEDTLLEINNIELMKGENNLSDRQMQYDKVSNIRLSEISSTCYCVPVNWYKDTVDLVVNCDDSLTTSIRVQGTYIVEDYDTIEKYFDNSKKDSIIELENRILRKELIETYTDGLINIMSMKNNKVKVTGFINPKIKLGDTVQFIGSRLNINDYYKVIGLKTSLTGGSYRATATLMKFIKTDLNVKDILYNQTRLLKQRLNGVTVNPLDVTDINSYEAEICENELGDAMTELKARLAGGA